MKYITFITCLFGLNLLNGQSKITQENFNIISEGYWKLQNTSGISKEQLEVIYPNIRIQWEGKYESNIKYEPEKFNYYSVNIGGEFCGILVRISKGRKLHNQLFFEYKSNSNIVTEFNKKELNSGIFNLIDYDARNRVLFGVTKVMSYFPD